VFLTIEKLLGRLATDRLVVVSEQQRREINERFRVGRATQFAVIPLGIDLDVYANWAERRTRFREELKAGGDELLIGIVGRLTEIKNHRLFLEAAALLKKDGGLKARFLVVGDGALREQLEAQAETLGLQSDVVFLGNRNDPENFYPALDIVALTSLNEGTPLSLIEAMANARPVIATAVGGVVDLLGPVSQGEAGYQICERGLKVESRDAEGFARGLRRLVEDEELRQTLADKGPEFVARNYSKTRLLADISELYEGLFQSHSIRRSSHSPEEILE
jgi:glycosyltransferase involved in cell wall biosynthesis